MSKAFVTEEIILSTKNGIGVLAKVTSPITSAKININACTIYASGQEAHFHLVTDNNKATIDVLKKNGYTPRTKKVVVLETKNEVGALSNAAVKLDMAGINVDYCYASIGDKGITWVVFSAEDLEEALKAISQ